MVLPGPARLSVDALAWLLEVEKIGEPHRALAPTAVWRPSDEADTAVAAAREEILALGWYDRRKRLEVEVAAALAVLCRAKTEFYGWIGHGESTVGVLAAAIGGQALLAVRDGDTVWLRPTGWPRLAEALAGQTADVPAGHGRAVTVARADVLGKRHTGPAGRVGPASVAVRRVQHIAALRTTGSGELYAAVRDGVGRHRISKPLCYADTTEGRYGTLTTVPGGQHHVLVCPASRADLVARLRELRRSLAR